MSQTTYSLTPTVALAGQLADNGPHDIVSLPAGGTIPAGSLVIFSAGTVILPNAATLASVVGVALWKADKEAESDYAQYDMVPVLRTGRVYARFSGGTDTAYLQARVNHPSTGATASTVQGVFTASATSATAGTEISVVPGAIWFREQTSSTLCLVELNLNAA